MILGVNEIAEIAVVGVRLALVVHPPICIHVQNYCMLVCTPHSALHTEAVMHIFFHGWALFEYLFCSYTKVP